MLFVFYMDTGTMLKFDVGIATQSVSHLQHEIWIKQHIPVDKQVLLISGGDNLDPKQCVASYTGAGMDSNPIFLFSKQTIEVATPPSNSVTFESVSYVEKVEDSMNLPPTYETLVSRGQLSVDFVEAAKFIQKACAALVHDQHQLHQGWAAVIANLDDITSAFRTRSDVFIQSLDDYLANRELYSSTIKSFPGVIDLLARMPLLSCLTTERSMRISSSSKSLTQPTTLLEWISAQDTRNTLEQMMQQCQAGMDQFDEGMKEALMAEVSSMLGTIDNQQMKEVKGLEDRLSRLEQLMCDAAKYLRDQSEISQGFLQNQGRARQFQDPTILPDLCSSHKFQLQKLLSNHQELVDIRKRCSAAKEELLANLHTRLRWVMYIEKSVCEIDNKLIIRHETLKKIKHRIEIVRQIHEAPSVYCRAVVEVVRRKAFSTKFLQMANTLSTEFMELEKKELEKRGEFNTSLQRHFLKTLFPGFEDTPPLFANKAPEVFDGRLPAVSHDDIALLQKEVPELSNTLELTVDTIPTLEMRSPVGQGTKSDGQNMDLSSQSVEIINPDEETLQGQTDVLPLAPAGPSRVGKSLGGSGAVDRGQRRGQIEGEMPGDGTLSPSEAAGDNTFMTADFYIDESMPSSMTDMSSSRKMAELQSALQEKSNQLSKRDKELSDAQQRVEELQACLTERDAAQALLQARLDNTESAQKKLQEIRAQDVSSLREAINLMRDSAQENFKILASDVKDLSQPIVKSAVKFLTDGLAEKERWWEEENRRRIELEAELASLNERLRLETEVASAAVIRAEQAEGKLEDTVRILSGCQADMEKLRQDMESSGKEIVELRQACSEKDAAIAENQTLVLALRGEKNELEVKSSELEAAIKQKDAEINKLTLEFEGFKNSNMLDVEHLHQSHANKLQEVIRESEAKLKELQDKCDLLSAELADANKAFEINEKAHEELIADITATRDLEVAKLKGELEKLKIDLENSIKIEEKQQKLTTNLSEEHDEFVTGLYTLAPTGDNAQPITEQKFELADSSQPITTEQPQNKEISSESAAKDDLFELQLRFEDTLSIERHEAIVVEIKAQLEQEKTAVRSALEEQINGCLVTIENLKSKMRLAGLDVDEDHSNVEDLGQGQTEEVGQGLAVEVDQGPTGEVDLGQVNAKDIDQGNVAPGSGAQQELGSSLTQSKQDSLIEAERQIKFNEALNRAVAARDAEISELMRQRTALQQTIEELKGQLQLQAIVATCRADSASPAIVPDLESNQREMSKSTIIPQGSSARSKPDVMSQSVIDQEPSQSGLDNTVVLQDLCRRLQRELKKKIEENNALHNKIMAGPARVRTQSNPECISLHSCNDGDIVLFYWSAECSQYTAYLSSDCSLHFLHNDTASALQPNTEMMETGNTIQWLVVQVVNKEHCKAKKDNNRFRLAPGTKFFRVRGRAFIPSCKSSLSDKSSSSDVASSETAPELTANQELANKQAANQELADKQVANKANQETANQELASKELANQEIASSGVDYQVETNQELANQELRNQEAALADLSFDTQPHGDGDV